MNLGTGYKMIKPGQCLLNSLLKKEEKLYWMPFQKFNFSAFKQMGPLIKETLRKKYSMQCVVIFI